MMIKKVENDRLSISCQPRLAQVSDNHTGTTRSGSIVGVGSISLWSEKKPDADCSLCSLPDVEMFGLLFNPSNTLKISASVTKP